jgi:hypothetical protein
MFERQSLLAADYLWFVSPPNYHLIARAIDKCGVNNAFFNMLESAEVGESAAEKQPYGD